VASIPLLGRRRESEAKLRDGWWLLRSPGHSLGPAGAVYALWRELAGPASYTCDEIEDPIVGSIDIGNFVVDDRQPEGVLGESDCGRRLYARHPGVFVGGACWVADRAIASLARTLAHGGGRPSRTGDE